MAGAPCGNRTREGTEPCRSSRGPFLCCSSRGSPHQTAWEGRKSPLTTRISPPSWLAGHRADRSARKEEEHLASRAAAAVLRSAGAELGGLGSAPNLTHLDRDDSMEPSEVASDMGEPQGSAMYLTESQLSPGTQSRESSEWRQPGNAASSSSSAMAAPGQPPAAGFQSGPVPLRVFRGFEGQPRAHVVAAEMLSEGKVSFVAYKIRVSDSAAEWTVARRFKNFELFHRRMRNVPGYQAVLPPKRILFHGKSSEFVEERRLRLHNYLQASRLCACVCSAMQKRWTSIEGSASSETPAPPLRCSLLTRACSFPLPRLQLVLRTMDVRRVPEVFEFLRPDSVLYHTFDVSGSSAGGGPPLSVWRVPLHALVFGAAMEAPVQEWAVRRLGRRMGASLAACPLGPACAGRGSPGPWPP